jgi:cytochrome c biogenesis protein CcdA
LCILQDSPSPTSDTSWKPSIATTINDGPFIIFLLIILVLGILVSTVSLVARYHRILILLIAIAFSLIFHSTPQRLAIEERYMEIITFFEPGKLNSNDRNILMNSAKKCKSWPRMQLIFGLLFATMWLWRESLLFYVIVLILLA